MTSIQTAPNQCPNSIQTVNSTDTDTMLQYIHAFAESEMEIIFSGTLLLVLAQCPMAKAKVALAQAVVEALIALALALSTPSTDARARASGNSVPGGTSHKAQTDHTVGGLLLGEEGPGDRGVPSPEYVEQLYHLPATCGPTHIAHESRDRRYHSIEALCHKSGQAESPKYGG
jgi:hypothetical protein